MKEIFFTASLFFPGDVPVHSPDCRKMTSDSPERRPDKPCVWCGLLREKMKAYNKKNAGDTTAGPPDPFLQQWL